MSSDDANDILFGSGVPSAKFKVIGDSVTGTIVKLDSSQQTEFKKDGVGEPKKWPDGRPMMQVIVTLQTSVRDVSVPDDDGKRRVFVKGKNLTDGVRSAVKAAGSRRLDEGGTLTVTLVGEETSDWGGNPAKVYTVTYAKPSGADAAAAVLGTVEAKPVAPVVGQQALDMTGVSPEVQAKLAQLLAAQA